MKKSHAILSVVIGIVAAAALSSAISIDLALFAGFVIAIALLIYSDRKKVKLEGIIFIRRTTKGRDFIDRVAGKYHRSWRKISHVGIALGIIFMILGSLLLLTQAYAVFAGAKDGGVKLLLPGPVSDPVNAPGVFVVPWWIWVIGIAVVIIPHEFMHGIMCRIDKVRIKSVGWLLLILIPGAFVEPDEKQLAKMPKRTKLRVYAAGSFANMIVAAIVLAIAFFSVFALSASSAIVPAGVAFAAAEGGPAHNASLNGSIIAIDGVATTTHSQLTAELQKHRHGDIIKVTTAETQFISGFFPAGVVNLVNTDTKEVTLAENPENGKPLLGIGVTGESVQLRVNFQAYAILSVLLFWIFLFSFGIGLVNLLPIKPLDGGLIFEELVGGRKKLVKAVSIFMLLVLLFNIIGPVLLS
ncbi:MAG: site-2 protease family protein [Candidatus Aenigmarchaeota archaeon]|nr:site-2 protease family protein [Candidatus Aenigmarchaeota archaeon]